MEFAIWASPENEKGFCQFCKSLITRSAGVTRAKGAAHRGSRMRILIEVNVKVPDIKFHTYGHRSAIFAWTGFLLKGFRMAVDIHRISVTRMTIPSVRLPCE